MHQNAPFRRRKCQNFSPQTPPPLGRGIPHPRRRLRRLHTLDPPRPHFWIRAWNRQPESYESDTLTTRPLISSISDGVLIQACSWVVFEDCPWGAGSLLAHIFYCLFSLFIHKVKMSLLYNVVLCIRLYS